MNTIADLYREVGAALHKAQLAEYNIVSAHILLSRAGLVKSEREAREEYWSKKTLGQLLKPVLEFGRLPEDAKLFIQTFVNARNHLTDSLFVSLSAIHTSAGLDALLWEVAEMQKVFDRATQLFDQVLSNLARPLGNELSEIKAEALAAVFSLEDRTECKG